MNELNETLFHDIMSTLSSNGYCFDNVTLESCEELNNSSGVTFTSFDFHSGNQYRVYCIKEIDNKSIYRLLEDNDDYGVQFVDGFKAITFDNKKDTENHIQIYLHKVIEAISLKDYLQSNFDDNFKLQFVYESFVSFYNTISKLHVAISTPQIDVFSVYSDHKILVKNLDVFICQTGNEDTNDSNRLNAICFLTFLRVVTSNPELLRNNDVFSEIENGLSEDFIRMHLIPFLDNNEYRLLFSIITCKQHGKHVEIEIECSNSCNTQFTSDEWQNAKLVSNGWYSPDGARFYGVRVQECTPRYSFHRFRSVPNSIRLEGERLSIICNHAFRECNYLEDVSIPEGVSTIGEDAFFGVKQIERINFPESLRAICKNPFKGVIVVELNNLSPGFMATRYALYSKGLHRLISFYGETEDFLVPSQTEIIGEQAFAYNKSIIEVSIGESVIEIRDEAFYLCPKLKKVTLPKSLKQIGERAFFQLDIKHDYDLDENKETFEPALEELRIPSNVEYIGRAAFNGIRKIENDSPYFKIVHDALLTNDGTNLIYYFGKAKKFRIPSGVVTVRSEAFMGNEHIEEITIPRSVRIIESNAFKDCPQLRSVVFNSDYLFLGDSAFFECKKLSSVKMPKRMGNLSRRTFWRCQSLSEIKIPEGVVIIGDASFWGCRNLRKVVLPSSIRIIEDSAFNYCEYLSEIHLPEGLKKISNESFQHCKSLSKIILPYSLEYVDKDAFSFCSLQECVVLNKETSFGNDVFHSNDDLLLFIPPKADPRNYTKVMPEGVRSRYETTEGSLPIFGPKTENIVPVIEGMSIEELIKTPESFLHGYRDDIEYDENGGQYIKGMQILLSIDRDRIKKKSKYIVSNRTKYICNDAFGNRNYWNGGPIFEKIVLPSKLVAIGDYCFAHSRIKEISLPDSLEYIGNYAFMNCSSLSSIVIPRNVNHIGNNPFYNSEKYVTYHLNEVISNSPHYVVESNCLLSKDKEDLISCFEKRKIDCSIPDGVKHICMYSFAMTEVKSLNIPQGVEKIGEGAFENGLFITISIPSQVKYLGKKAFSRCSSLQKIDISNTQIGVIENELFDECESLENINLPDNTTSVGDYAFRGCKKLVSINIPPGVNTIGVNPFMRSGITEIILNNSGFKLIDGIFYGGNGKEIIAVLSSANKTIIIPNGVETICQEAFASNIIIEKVVCPKSLKSIGKKAFARCASLKMVDLVESSVTILPESIFDGCKMLDRISFPAHLSEIANYAFQYCDNLQSLTLPRSIKAIGDKAFESSGLKCIYLNYGIDVKILPWSFRSRGKAMTAYESGLSQDEFGVVFSKDKTILIDVPSDLESYAIPRGTEQIENGAFKNARNLKRVSFPNTVKKLGDEVFNCDFDELILPNSVTEIGHNLFLWGHHMKEFIIPSSVVAINGNPFSLMGLYRKKPCKIINNSKAFSLINGVLYSKDLSTLICCTDLVKKTIDILDTVKYINDNAFCGSQAQQIIIPSSVCSIGKQSFKGIKVPEIYIPGSVEIIEEGSFESCSASKVVLSEGIKEIRCKAFSNCMRLEEITIPKSVERIEKSAFAACHQLHTIIISNIHLNLDSEAFIYCENIKRVVVPKGTLGRSKKVLPQFFNRIEETVDNEA